MGTGIEPPIVGFYTTRIVRAASPEAAAKVAARRVSSQWTDDPTYAGSNVGSPPILSVEWVKNDTFLGSLLFRATGHTFYPADPA